MQLRRRLESQPETVSDFASSAEQRYWEGIELAAAGRPGSGIYLLGFAAEMLLKTACFRVNGAGPADVVDAQFGPAKFWMKQKYPTIGHESYHSLLFWLGYLRGKRRDQNRPFAKQFDGDLVHHVGRLYALWWVEMRYRPDQATAVEVNRAFASVSWLRDRFLELWR